MSKPSTGFRPRPGVTGDLSIAVVAAKRTPFGTMQGSLKGISATDLALHAAKAALEQCGIDKRDIGHVVVGNVMQTSADAIYCARHVGSRLGCRWSLPRSP